MTIDQARREFPHTWSDMVYLNHAAVAPLSFRVRDAVDRYQTRRALKGIEPYPWMLKTVQGTREMLAQLMGARADQIAFVLNTSDGLNIIAQGLDWQPGDHVLLNDLEFPANVYPFLNLKRHGVEVDFIEKNLRPSKAGAGGGYSISVEDIQNHLTPRTKLVSISHVQFATGAKADLNAIGKLCRERDILFAVDAIQSLPHTPIDVERDCVDFLACGSHKWMMSDMGAAFVYVGDRALARIHQASLGWTSIENAFDFSLRPDELRAGAARFENGTINFAGITALLASLNFFFEFGLQEMERAVLDLTGYLIDRLEMRGVEVITPKPESERSGIVSFNFPDAEKVFERLQSRNILISLRQGLLRASPHFYNTEEEVRKLMVALFE
ncbi:MAG: aminotransferase class V-fold PLP-dependent enzyme [Bacteroidota bacterium]|nr:aminotransferase class V-fold PLP-dependent enzyme [Bacteroidota bacterium]MDP4232204.1 aminotransferase class V-fold PLP-dependent enzyme [Bacteroidota bacterium]MDP4243615.1 aminotransferase class V-fold PLP-dependent enzyme [Bacteroidota bacterium]MDP4288732.1 aminotransferase class V-fold PLP-dependent enzyme [Bacteroidota bacterium]